MNDLTPDYVTAHLALDAANGADRWDPSADMTETQEMPTVRDEEVIAELGRET